METVYQDRYQLASNLKKALRSRNYVAEGYGERVGASGVTHTFDLTFDGEARGSIDIFDKVDSVSVLRTFVKVLDTSVLGYIFTTQGKPTDELVLKVVTEYKIPVYSRDEIEKFFEDIEAELSPIKQLK